MTIDDESISVIDLTGWRASGDVQVARRFLDAFRKTGFAYVSGHGVPREIVDDAFAASHAFFAHDPETLDAIHYRHANKFHGFVPRGVSEGMGAYHEWYDVGRDVDDGYVGPGSLVRSVPNLWPEGLPAFRPAIERYQAAVRDVADCVLSAIATAVSLPQDFFRSRCTDAHVLTRLLHHVPPPAEVADTYSVGEHCDYEMFTLLYQDDVGGLQVRGRHGNWIEVPPIDNTFVVNAGDMLTHWTNGLIPATPHRVLSPRTTDRYSIAYFYATSYDVVIEPVLPPVEGLDQQFEPITTGDYISSHEGGYFATTS